MQSSRPPSAVLLADFSTWTGKRYKPSSLKVYGAILGKLEALALDRGEDLQGASRESLSQFLAGRNPNTAKRYAWFLDDFYDHLQQRGVITESPAFGFRALFSYPEVPAQTTGFSAEEEEAAFLAALPEPSNWKHARDAGLLALSLGTGIKLNEVLALKLSDIYLDQDIPSVLVRHRHSTREVPIRRDALPYVQRWACEREVHFRADVLEAFPATTRGGALSPSTVWRQAKKVLARAGVEHLTHFGASALRVSYARIEDAEGSRLPILQHRLGHKRESSTIAILKTERR